MTTFFIPPAIKSEIIKSFQPVLSIAGLSIPIKTIEIPPQQTKFPRSKKKRIRKKWANNPANYSEVAFIVNEDLIKPKLCKHHPIGQFTIDGSEPMPYYHLEYNYNKVTKIINIGSTTV